MFLQVISAAYYEEELKKEDGSTDNRVVLGDYHHSLPGKTGS